MNTTLILIVVVVVLFFLSIYLFIQRKKKSTKKLSKKSELKENIPERKGETFILESKITKKTQENPQEVIINENDFEGAKGLLFIKIGKNSGAKFPLKQNIVNIGREVGNEIVVDDIRASRTHSRIIFDENKFYIEDLSSTNGTFVNNNRITKTILNDGDKIKIGDTILVFKVSK